MKNNPGPILGYGNQDADVMFIGDIAKIGDVTLSVPFTGIAKKRMTQALKESGLKKDEYYLTYMIKHVMISQRNLDSVEFKPCLKILLEEIELINPRIICSMGYYVTKALMAEYNMEEGSKSMRDLHGNGYIIPARKYYKGRYKKREDDRPKRYLIPTWSPSVDNIIMNGEMLNDVKAVKTVQKLTPLLFDS